MNFDNYKFRCSALGKIVSKSGKFTDGNKTYIEEVFNGEVYNVRKEITSKYFEKGLFEEESGITLLNKTLYPKSIIVKNKERKENEWIHGEADCIKDGIVYDIKNAWDKFTFAKADLTHDYNYQLIGYMWLWELDKARLFYCLNNTPDHIFESEARKMLYTGNFISEESPEYIEAYNNLKEKHTHDNMPLEERFKLWDISRSDEQIEVLKKSITMARNYMNELWNDRQATIQKNRELMGLDSQLLPIHDPQLHNTVIFDSPQ